VQDETIWLTQKAMAALFGVQIPAINKHLKNIFNEGELDEQVVNSAKVLRQRSLGYGLSYLGDYPLS
jgi:hypothetical protein